MAKMKRGRVGERVVVEVDEPTWDARLDQPINGARVGDRGYREFVLSHEVPDVERAVRMVAYAYLTTLDGKAMHVSREGDLPWMAFLTDVTDEFWRAHGFIPVESMEEHRVVFKVGERPFGSMKLEELEKTWKYA